MFWKYLLWSSSKLPANWKVNARLMGLSGFGKEEDEFQELQKKKLKLALFSTI